MKKFMNCRNFSTCFWTMLVLCMFWIWQMTALTAHASEAFGESSVAAVSEEDTAETLILKDGKASAVSYGQLLQSSLIEGTVVTAQGETVEGTFSWMEPHKMMCAVGTAEETVVFITNAEPVSEDGEEDASASDALAAPVTFELSVTVNKAVPKVVTWPEIVISDTLYDGDKVSDKLSLKGGSAKYTLEKVTEELEGAESAGQEGVKTEAEICHIAAVQAEESVPGSFQWETPELELKTGKQALILWFVPEDEKSFERVKSRVWVEAKSRPVTITLEILSEQQAEENQSEQRICLGKSAEFEVAIPKTDVLTKINGKAYLWIDEQQIEITLTEKDEGWSASFEWKPKAVGEYSLWAQYIPEDSSTSQAKSDSLKMTVYEPLVFEVVCQDITYGKTPEPEILTEYEQELNFSFRYEGTGETDYQESETAPTMPGTYRVTAVVEDHEDYAGEEQSADFTIKKADPVLELKADPDKMTGSQEVALYITLKNPENAEWKDGLPTQLTVSTDKAVKVKESLAGEEGVYTFWFVTENADMTVRCSVRTGENDCYNAAEAYVDVAVSKEKENESETETESVIETKNDSKTESVQPSGTDSESSEPKVKTPEEVEADFWQDVIFRIYKAQEKGETVTINAKGHGSMPDKVMEALRTHTKVTLALVWEGDMIVIPAGKALDYDKAYKSWTLGELSKRYPLAKNQTAQTAGSASGQNSNGSAAVSTDANAGSQSANTGSQSVSGTKNAGSSTEVPIKHSAQEDESGETEGTETEESSEETSSEAENLTQDSEEIIVPEEEIFSESTSENKIDWTMVAICACAGVGLIAILTAVISTVRKKRLEDEEDYLEEEDRNEEEENFGDEDEFWDEEEE